MTRPITCDLLDAARLEHRWSIAQLAEATGFGVHTVRASLAREPSLTVLLRLGRVLELSPAQLRRVGRDDAAQALDVLGEEFDFTRVPTSALIGELTRRAGGPATGSWIWVRSGD